MSIELCRIYEDGKSHRQQQRQVVIYKYGRARQKGTGAMTTYKKHLTNELIDAIDTVCGACPYIVDENDNAGEKYCERCMVRHMVNLFNAEDKNGDYLPMSAPEWQAIINY